MADITQKMIIRGGHQYAGRPFDWHVWDVTFPEAAGPASGDDIVLPGRFDQNAVLLDVMTQVITAASATTFTFTAQAALRAIDGGAITGASAITGAINLLAQGTARSSTTTPFPTFGSGVTEGTNERIVKANLTALTGTLSGDARFVIAALIGRSEY